MGYPTDRVLMYNTQDEFIGELAPHEVKKRLRVEQINDEHELTIVTTRVLHVGTRLLTVDGTGKWREHVVYKPDEKHESGEHAEGTYVCMWSLQYDLTEGYTEEHAEPGMGSSCTAAHALAFAIADSPRWHVGTVDVGSVAAGKGCVMIGISDWERLKLVVKHWGGEVDAEIAVDGTHVTSRGVALRAHLGSSTVRRRFDWGHDLKSISRAADEGPYFCRVVPLGRGQREYAEDDETEFDWPLDISEETGGRVWIEDEEAALVFRTKNPDGTYHYPTKVVEYDEDDPELLLNRGLEDLPNHTRPGVRYEAGVVQFVEAGMDAHGLALGDETQCSDWGFNEDAALKVQGRVTRMEVNELDPNGDTNLTIGELGPSLAHTLYDLVSAATSSLTKRVNHIDGGGTIAYLETLIDQLNEQINATGGYTYLAQGEGNITYDIAVDDPLVGYNFATHTWASQVTQMKGGSLRFANSKKPSFQGINDWNWATVITPEGFLGLAATIAAITTGFIGSSGDTYIDLDNHTAQLGQTSGPHIVVNLSGMQVYNSSTSLGFFGVESNVGIVRVGQASQGNVVASSDGTVDIRKGSNIIAHFGYGDGINASGTISKASYYTIGSRKGSSVIGNHSYAQGYDVTASGYHSHAEGISTEATAYTAHAEGCESKASGSYSHAEGYSTTASGSEAAHAEGYSAVASGSSSHAEGANTVASGYRSHAEGDGTKASYNYSHAEGYQSEASGNSAHAEGYKTKASDSYSHAEGYLTKASGYCSHAEGDNTEASGNWSHAEGYYTKAIGSSQHVFGSYNVTHSSHVLIAGHGGPDDRSNIMYLSTGGNFWIAGTFTQNSDRRLKEHHAYLGEDACEFVRKLRPALYTKDGERHTGFYAQDVQEAEPDGWDTVTVTSQHTDESLDFDPLTLDYSALIAPLVAYAQSLEKRIDRQQGQIDALTRRLETLEAGR